jgi:hypothetical protein
MCAVVTLSCQQPRHPLANGSRGLGNARQGGEVDPVRRCRALAVTRAERRPGWGSSRGGSATEGPAAPTSIPAACRLTAARGGERGCCWWRRAMVAAVITGDTARGSGRGSGGVAGLFHTGSGQRLSPLGSPQAPGTTRINGHTPPGPLRPHTAHCHHPRMPPPALLCLAVARPHSGLTTLIRVRP